MRAADESDLRLLYTGKALATEASLRSHVQQLMAAGADYPGNVTGSLDESAHSQVTTLPRPDGQVDYAALPVTLGDCPGAEPFPTLAPGVTPVVEPANALSAGFTVGSDLRLRYSALGIARVATIQLPFELKAMTGNPSVFGCPE